MQTHCMLCGTLHDNFRVMHASVLKSAVEERFLPSAFVYKSVMNLQANVAVFVCKHCMLVLRRANGSKCSRTVIPSDQVFQFMVHPGKNISPDVRNTRRLLRTIARDKGRNYYASFPCLRVVIDAVFARYRNKGDEISAVVSAWWDLNGRCVFFGNRNLARSVRHVVKHRGMFPDEALDNAP